MQKIKVHIVDDSAAVRMVLATILESDPGIEVIDASLDPIIAQRKLTTRWPDVFILDIEMPRMDGITFLKKIMQERPTPVIICSTLIQRNTAITIEALSLGAVEVIKKPTVGIKDFLIESQIMLIDAVKSAVQANIKILKEDIHEKTISAPPAPSPSAAPFSSEQKIAPKLNADVILPPPDRAHHLSGKQKIIAIGASAGGTHAIESILKELPSSNHGIVIVQHMPEKFTYAFANRLNSICDIEVKEAQNGDKIRQGLALIAPGNIHMLVKKMYSEYQVTLKEGPRVSRHRPSVDVLFRSVSQVADKNALGIILTGMGDDGAAGMLEMKNSGIRTIAQDKSTSVVFGMPHEAIKKGAVEEVLPLPEIANRIKEWNQ